MISKEFATTYMKYRKITGKRITQKGKKCDWSVKSDLKTKIAYIIPKNDKFDICYGKKIFFLKIFINEMQIKHQIIKFVSNEMEKLNSFR